MVPIFRCLFWEFGHSPPEGKNQIFQTFRRDYAKIPSTGLFPAFLRIQNFLAFFNYLPAVVFSQVSDVGLAQRSSQNRGQPVVCVLLAHQSPLVQLIKIPMSFIAQRPEFPVRHGAHGDLRSGMYPDIGIAGRKSAANIEHGVLIITAVNSVRTFQNRMTATVRTSGSVVLSSFLCHGSFLQNKKSGRLRHHKPQRERLLLAVIVAVQPSGNHRNKPTPLWIAHR